MKEAVQITVRISGGIITEVISSVPAVLTVADYELSDIQQINDEETVIDHNGDRCFIRNELASVDPAEAQRYHSLAEHQPDTPPNG